MKKIAERMTEDESVAAAASDEADRHAEEEAAAKAEAEAWAEQRASVHKVERALRRAH